MTDLAFHPRPQVLFICGNRNHTTTMHAIARELPDCERWFTPYYCDGGSLLDYLRRARLLEFVALGHDFRRRCLAYLHQHDLPIDLGGARGGYDLVVTCSDLIVPSNVAGVPLVGVQEGMIDPKLFWWRVMELCPWLQLPRWAAGTACTGLSHAYDAYCVASEGYRKRLHRARRAARAADRHRAAQLRSTSPATSNPATGSRAACWRARPTAARRFAATIAGGSSSGRSRSRATGRWCSSSTPTSG